MNATAAEPEREVEALDGAIEEVLEETLSLARLDGVLRAVGIAGSPRSPSKSRALLELLLDDMEKLGAEVRLIDVAALPPAALLAREPSPEIDDAISAVGQADIVVAASPAYRALYSGALKCFFDLLPEGHLADKVCVGLMTGALPAHALAAEYGFRPLFASLGGAPLAVLYATDDQFEEGRPGESLREAVRDIADAAVSAAGAP